MNGWIRSSDRSRPSSSSSDSSESRCQNLLNADNSSVATSSDHGLDPSASPGPAARGLLGHLGLASPLRGFTDSPGRGFESPLHHRLDPLNDSMLFQRARMDEDEEEQVPRKIMVAVDGSEESNAALWFALNRVAIADVDRVIILHVRQAGPDRHAPASSPKPQAAASTDENCPEKILQDACKGAHALGISVKTVMAEGDVKSAICSMVEKEAADILILGTKCYKSSLKTFKRRTIAAHCFKKCACSVFLYQGVNGGEVLCNKRAIQSFQNLPVQPSCQVLTRKPHTIPFSIPNPVK